MSAIIEQLGPERTMLTLTLKKIGDKRKDEDNDSDIHPKKEEAKQHAVLHGRLRAGSIHL